MTLPNRLYEIYIYNHDGTLYTPLLRWDRLEFTQRLDSPWSHSLQLRVQWEEPLGDILRALKRDMIIDIWRYDIYDGIKRLAYSGLHSTTAEQVQTSGDIFFNLYGTGYTKFLERRVAVPPADVDEDVRIGKAETIAKQFVGYNFTNPADINRKMPDFVVAGDLGRGPDTEYSARYTNMLSVIEAICADGELHFGVERKDGLFVFDARPLWGKDLRQGYTANPVLFGVDYRNMLIPILTANHRYEVNVVYVGGAGRGVDQIVREMNNADSLDDSPWARSEAFVNASDTESQQELRAIGQKELDDRGVKREFVFDTKETVNSRWLYHYNLGDLITAYYKNTRFDKTITEITATVTAGSSAQRAELIQIEMDDV